MTTSKERDSGLFDLRTHWGGGTSLYDAIDRLVTTSGPIDVPLHVATDPARAQLVFDRIRLVLEDPTPSNLRLLHKLLRKEKTRVNAIAVPLIGKLHDELENQSEGVHQLAMWLATRAPDADSVKVGLTMLALSDEHRSGEVVRKFAQCEAFAAYVLLATQNWNDRDALLLRMAKACQGWGRTQALRLMKPPFDPETKRWLLREGAVHTHLAYTAATLGELHVCLRAEHIDDRLLKDAGGIILGLTRRADQDLSPFNGDMKTYEHGAAATERYLAHLRGRAAELGDYLRLKEIELFIEKETLLEVLGWTRDARGRIFDRIREILDPDKWLRVVQQLLEAEDEGRFRDATKVATHLGLDLDLWDVYYARTQAGENHWEDLIDQPSNASDERARIDRVVELAEAQLLPTLLPFSEEEDALEWVLYALREWPGVGWRLIKASIQSHGSLPHWAIKAFSQWDRADWPLEAVAVIEERLREEPDAGDAAHWVTAALELLAEREEPVRSTTATALAGAASARPAAPQQTRLVHFNWLSVLEMLFVAGAWVWVQSWYGLDLWFVAAGILALVTYLILRLGRH